MKDSRMPIPAGYRLRPTDDLRRLSDGRILIGGSPLAIVRLSEAGASTVSSWFAGEEVGDAPGHRDLARRLRGNGMAHLEPNPDNYSGATQEDSESAQDPQASNPLTVIIPVKDDQAGLDQTLTTVLAKQNCSTSSGGDLSVIVVDDGSSSPLASHHPSVTVIRNDDALGPGGARQLALASVATDLICFVDAGVEISSDALSSLSRRLGDPAVVAVAPRIVSPPLDHLVGRYDQRRSPLDLGPSTALVGIGKTVPYVPTACLMVRAEAVELVGGFDPDLRYGEDVDLVWRLCEIGDVLYLAEIEVTHPPRRTIIDMAKQRMSYGSAAAPLAERHGDAVSPARLSGWSVLIAALVAAGHPIVACGASTWTALALRPKIEPLPDVTVEAMTLTAKGHWYGGLSLLTALARAWSPLAIAAMVLLPSQRRRLALLMACATGRRLLDGPRQPAAAGLDLALGAVDDLSYCAGVWKGVLQSGSPKSLKSLMPAVVSWPGRKGGGDQK